MSTVPPLMIVPAEGSGGWRPFSPAALQAALDAGLNSPSIPPLWPAVVDHVHHGEQLLTALPPAERVGVTLHAAVGDPDSRGSAPMVALTRGRWAWQLTAATVRRLPSAAAAWQVEVATWLQAEVLARRLPPGALVFRQP